MSNEYKDWLYDKVQDTVLNANVIDKISNIEPHWHNHSYVVSGYKDNTPVKFEVWLSDWTGEWKFERVKINT